VAERKHACKRLVGKPFEVCNYMWEDNVMLLLKGTGFEGSDWIRVMKECCEGLLGVQL
jgi:hypothetical protein